MNRLPVLKVVVAGDGTVGKTSLIRRYCEGKFETTRVQTIGVDFQTQTVELPDIIVKLSIWDMAGQDRFEVMRAGFYRGSRASALVFDVTQEASFGNLERWKGEILNTVHEQPFLVVGNKIDLDRRVTMDEANAFATSIGAVYIETSALSGQGVPTLFESLAERALKR